MSTNIRDAATFYNSLDVESTDIDGGTNETDPYHEYKSWESTTTAFEEYRWCYIT